MIDPQNDTSDVNINALEEGDSPESLPSGDDLALSALAGGGSDDFDENTKTQPASKKSSSFDDEEAAASDQLAETLNSLQNLIERHANELTRISNEVREKRESLKNIFDNDQSLGEAKAQLDVFSEQLKERKSQMQADAQVVNLKVAIGELNQEKKEIEETLSNHLVNYHSLTNSTSFDTSDGDQWEFKIRAKIKTKK